MSYTNRVMTTPALMRRHPVKKRGEKEEPLRFRGASGCGCATRPATPPKMSKAALAAFKAHAAENQWNPESDVSP
jgi:hypothetical protein